MRPIALCIAFVWSGLLVAQESAPKVDFANDVAPILVGRCVECHGPQKQKGKLRLDTKAHAFAEADSGEPVIVAGDAAKSEMIRRLGLAADDEDLMPAKGGALTAAQQATMTAWVAAGAVWPDDGDAVIQKALAAQELPKAKFALPELSADARAAIDAAVADLQQRGFVVQKVANDTRALRANLALLRDKVGDTEVALLRPLAPELVWLDLAHTAITDAALADVATFANLQRLSLAETKVGDAGIAAVAKLPQLAVLNAYGTAITDAALVHLVDATALQKLYVWRTAVTAPCCALLQAKLTGLAIDRGDYAETRLQAAAAEVAQQKAAAAATAPINAKCPVSGEDIAAGITLDHDGKKVGFCCDKCKAKFAKDPAAFTAKLPQ